MDPIHKHSPNAAGEAATLHTLYSPFLETIAPRPALTHFFPSASLKKPTWARKSSSQEEMVRQLLGEHAQKQKRFLSCTSSKVTTY